ncbi:D-alanine--poly(phosphoribitol) ligase subunit DltA [Paenibacillus gyeongsangnamensis]
MTRIIAALEDVYRTFSDRIAFTNQQMNLTYRELWEQSDALAAWMLEQSPAENERPVVLYGHMEPLLPVCFLACMKAGKAYIPLDSSLPDKRVERIVLSSGAGIVLSPARFPFASLPSGVRLVDSSSGGSMSLDDIIHSHAARKPDPAARMREDGTVYIIYTSGSTGDPKGVPISQKNLLSFEGWMRDAFPFSPEDVVLNQAPFSFDLSVMGVYPAFLAGASLWTADQALIGKPKLMFEAMSRSGLSVWISTPSFAEICLMEPSFSEKLLPRLRMFLFCGEMLPSRTVRKLMERFPGTSIVNTYGPTEATVAVTSIIVDSNLLAVNPQLPVGTCKPDCRIRIWDEEEREVREGEKGEIVICGPSVSYGYFANDEKTSGSFRSINDRDLGITRAYKTGDLGYIQDGMLICCGRIDFQVKLHGYRIELEEIEHRLRELPGVKSGAVVPHWKAEACDYLTAYVVPDEPPVSEVDTVSGWKTLLAERLPAYMIPRKFVLRPALPINGNGKLDRKRLQQEEAL